MVHVHGLCYILTTHMLLRVQCINLLIAMPCVAEARLRAEAAGSNSDLCFDLRPTILILTLFMHLHESVTRMLY